MAFWNAEILGTGVTQLLVPTGATGLQFGPVAGQVQVIFGAISGGTLALTNSLGQTSAQGFILGNNSLLKIESSGALYLAAGGATVTASVLYLQSAVLPPDNN